MSFAAALLLPLLFHVTLQSDVVDQVATATKTVFHGSEIAGESVRQCSCEEQKQCASEMEDQVMGCVDPCWTQFSKITSHPDQLKICFDKKSSLLRTFLTCFEEHLDSCVASAEGPHIPKTNISELFRLGEHAITLKTDKLGSTVAGPVKKILDVTGDFALCVKDCFLKKNEKGFCFDRIGCQPLIVERKAKKTLRKCTKSINWKKEAGELCDCSVAAGLSDLKDYCSLLHTIGSRRKSSGQ